MSNLTKPRQQSWEKWRDHLFTLAVGQKVWRGSEIGMAPDGKVKKMGSDPDLRYIGTAKQDVDATDAAKSLNVDLGEEITLRWWGNDATSPVNAIGGLAYALDDQTATRDPSYAAIGLVWAISATDGVLVQKLQPALTELGGVGGGGRAIDLPGYTSNNAAPADIVSGALYDVPTTAAAVTITLPADAEEGTNAWFSADGVKNAHTVTYRDATGPVALTTALTALKRHLVHVVMLDGTWRANAYVSP